MELTKKLLIKKSYETINNHFLKFWHIKNNADTRGMVKALLKIKLENVVDDVICDKTNNPVEVIENQILVARLISKSQYDNTYKYIDLTFGKVEIDWDSLLEEEYESISY